MELLRNALIGIAALVSGIFGGVQHFGSVTLTTLNGSDHQNTFPTTYNANNTALNNGKIDVGSSSIAAVTTLSNLSTVGTITSGVWNGTKLAVAYGGTGSSTPTGLLWGDGAGTYISIGPGTSGQLLTSNGTGVAPAYTSSSFDQTIAYNLTGSAVRIKNLNASSTAANPITLNGIAYNTPASRAASSTILAENGSGSLSFNTLQQLGASQLLEATTTDLTVANTTFETTYATDTARILLANQFKTTSLLSVRVYISSLTGQSSNSLLTLRLKIGGTTVCSVSNGSDLTASNVAPLIVTFDMSATSTSAQSCRSTTDALPSTVFRLYNETFSNVDLTADNQVSLTAQWNGNTGNSLTIAGAEFMKY